MAVDVLYLADDRQSYCTLVDPTGSLVHVAIVELSPQTALLETSLSFMPNAYVKVTLELRATTPKAMFAYVINFEDAKLRIRWLHFDPSDEIKLKGFLDAFSRSADLLTVAKAKEPTREVTRNVPRIDLENLAEHRDHQSTETSGEAKVMVGADGKMDIEATIRSQAKTIRASELAARHDKVHVLNMGTIKVLIQDAVSEALTHINASMSELEKQQLLEETEARFQERLKTFQAEKVGAQEFAKQLNEQLRKAQNLLEEERKRTISADQFTVSESGMGQIEDRMQRVLNSVLKSGNVSPEVEDKLREMIAHILDQERERIRIQEQEAQGAKIDLLEKKLRRLSSTLEETEIQRDQAQALANALEKNGGLHGIMLAGITGSDSDRKRKLALMKEILDRNRKIREDLGVFYFRGDKTEAHIDRDGKKLPDAKVETQSASDQLVEESEQTAKVKMEIELDPVGIGESVMINPDDMTWEVTEIKVFSDEERDSGKPHTIAGIKRFSTDSTVASPASHRKVG